jgi:restriction-modification enzyme MmeI-like protein
MNPVEIEQAISELAARPFEREAFPVQFLEAFGNRQTTLRALKKGTTNKSDVGGVLQRNNIHILTTDPGGADDGLRALHESPATKKHKVKFVLATDGGVINAEEMASGEVLACTYDQLADHFVFFLLMAGISPVAEIKNNPFDIKATVRLNKLYLELLRQNPDWASDRRRADLNHFMARLIFCFFAEDTDIFLGDNLFSATIEQMSDSRSGNADKVVGEIFRAMNTGPQARKSVNLRPWADAFPYVNGGLFGGNTDVPVFSRLARTYLFAVGKLNWKEINPDIFGSMIQAVADEKERGNLGLHYTSVPNILKVLNPLFLDDLGAQLEKAGNNQRKLANLKKRMAKIRVFDPACGSGNFLVIAYKQMRKLEAEINRRRGGEGTKSIIPLTNFRGIELRDFPAEIARLALIIAEYQCDVLYRGQKEALVEFLPLDAKNWITRGNALRLDWLSICPPTDTGVKLRGEDLFATPLEQAEIDFENEGGETYICGNPPYKGSQTQTKKQKGDLKFVFEGRVKSWKQIDYIGGWFLKAADYAWQTRAASAFVSTNSICQGRIVPILWPLIHDSGREIAFAHTSFKWDNLASHNAGVTVVIIGLDEKSAKPKRLFSEDADGKAVVRMVDNINPYLVPAEDVIVNKRSKPLGDLAHMSFGNMPIDGGNLLMSRNEMEALSLDEAQRKKFIRRIYGSAEFIRGLQRFCLWINDQDLEEALQIPTIAARIDGVRQMRLASRDKGANAMAEWAHQMREMNIGKRQTIALPGVSSEGRPYLPVGLLDNKSTVSNLAFALYDAPLWNMALIASRLHLVWIATVCGKLKTDFRYSNTLGWNTFPVPPLSENNKADLTRCAEDILLARETHFPATIADLYKKDAMPENLRRAHDKNDETLERIYIGRRFKNDTERLEKLFEMYTMMTSEVPV